MNRMRKKTFKTSMALILSFVIAAAALFGIPAPKSEAASHPFLIVNASEFEELRSRASEEPWATFKRTAISDAKTLTFNKAAGYGDRCTSMREILEACSLAYILDPDNKDLYIDKILDVLNYWKSDVEGNIFKELDSTNWTYAIPPSGAFFSSVLALDIIYPDLTPEEIANAEAIL
jgi:hypothetical protein